MNSALAVLVIFGATGDLFRRKLAPSLYTLFKEQRLHKNVRIIGLGRTGHSPEAYMDFVRSAVKDVLGVEPDDEFIQLFSYTQGELHEKSLYDGITQSIHELEALQGSNAHIIWYCSIAPHLYGDIAKSIHEYTNFLDREAHYNKFLIEKPIGHDLVSCESLNASIGQYFKEEQIQRIEHYLTKETLQCIPRYLAESTDVHELLQGAYVSHIVVHLCETLGVEKRGSFYDSVGAFRDVGQNHLLEMLAISCAAYTGVTSEKDARIMLLEQLAEVNRKPQYAKRYQYSGYQNIQGVKTDSQVETAFDVSGLMPQQRWGSIPFVLRGGKRVGKRKKTITFYMKDTALHAGKQLTSIIISIDPECVEFNYTDGTQHVHHFRPNHKPMFQYVEEYARILSSALDGISKFSVDKREVSLLWKISDAFLSVMEHTENGLIHYEPDTDPFQE